MPAYKDEKQKTWYCQFYYEDWQGNKKKKKKRGFKTKKEAQEWENNFKLSANADMDMKLAAFVEIYLEDKKVELKQRTLRNKRYMIETHIIPYLGDKKMNEIVPADIISWQKNIKENNDFSQAYLRMLQNQITGLFNHATNIYGLKNSPCKKVKKMGRSDDRSLNFWTLEEYQKFIATFEKGSIHYVMFEILFWTGMREGELLALTTEDIDLFQLSIEITKTYYRMNKTDIITEPKTENSIRTIAIPQFLADEIREFYNSLYKYPSDIRLFPFVAEAVQHIMKRHAEKAGVNKIRVHDLRHSHCAYLINQGVQPIIIKERLGHKDIKITLNTYGHLYPSEQKKVADMLNSLNKNENAPVIENKGTSE